MKASLPYFIPLPYVSFLGTLGAVIRIRSPIPHKRALLDIGASGPLAGFVVALAACAAGLPQSRVVDPGYFDQLPFANPEPFLQLGAPPIFAVLSAWLMPVTEPGDMVLLSPVAFAGWVGLFITAFNLFPVGQLDGGHVSYAVFGRWHRYIARATFALLMGLGLHGIFWKMLELPPGWPGWIFLALLLALLGRDHPAPFYPNVPLDPRRRRLRSALLRRLFLLFHPPFRSVFRNAIRSAWPQFPAVHLDSVRVRAGGRGRSRMPLHRRRPTSGTFPQCADADLSVERTDPSSPFGGRTPDCPSGILLVLREPTTAEAVLFNVRDSFRGFSPVQYLDQLEESFLFVPDADGVQLYLEVFQPPDDYTPNPISTPFGPGPRNAVSPTWFRQGTLPDHQVPALVRFNQG